ncbi:MAG TPA: hypothetical protein VEY12_01855, partial [Thermoplasmata archaeon]|nr:hypothetical protein [Thermoplasmata archaeon]
RRQEPPPIEFLKPGETQPPPPTQQGPVAWVTRPEDYQRPTYPAGPAPPRPPPSGRLGLAAGILLVLAGVVGIAYTVYSSLIPISYSDYVNLTADQATFVTNQVCGILVIAAQAAALLGGIMAIQRLNWKLTMVCAILATLTLGFYLSASFMGMAGFTLVLLARKEFRS